MKFNQRHFDDWLFVICLLVPLVFATARYFESERTMDQIAQAQEQRRLAAEPKPAPVRLAYAQSHGR
jgi:hypothetical protein